MDADFRVTTSMQYRTKKVVLIGYGEVRPMSDLISREAAIKAAINADMENNDGILSEKNARVIEEHFSIVPTIDAVPVVRCKDCVFHKDDNVDHWCEHKFVTFEGFCKNGKRRTDGKENAD